MTGFGRAEGVAGPLRWIWELRCVNGRGLDIRTRLPTGFEALEGPVREAAQKKMRLWAANGVELGWLIDADNRCVYVYSGAADPRLLSNAESIAGEGPVEGFVLPLGEIWTGL